METLKIYPETTKIFKRIESIDLLRGFVMVLMALDHVRDYTHYGYMYSSPTDLDTTSPWLFFTRWITHFCAPIFVFLAGTSAFLYGDKKASKKSLSKFLFTRGLWLIFIELTVVNFGWSFDFSLSWHMLQVIWAIGICMVFLAAFIHLPFKIILSLGLIIVFGHNLLDSIFLTGDSWTSVLWYFFHQSNGISFNEGKSLLFVGYPFLPWLGIMILGYCLGTIYLPNFDAAKRKKILLYLGITAIIIFLFLRISNFYGDSNHWKPQKNILYNILSVINTSKYPPSLLYTLMTLGPALLILRFLEDRKNKISDIFLVIGRVPFFYYILHLFVIHIIGILGLMYLGESWHELIYTPQRLRSGFLADKGFSLVLTYVFWILTIVILYPFCLWYMKYKARNKDKWWLSYL